MFRYRFILFLALASALFAKRSPQPFLYPVDDGIYRFVVRENSEPNKKHVYQGGHVVAYLKVTGEPVWEKYLYKVRLDPKVESDVQNVYLKQMYLDKPNRLILENERGEWFVLDRRTGNQLETDKFKRVVPTRKTETDEEGTEEDETVEPLLQGDYLIEVDPIISYGHQKVRATDVPTGKPLWEKKVTNPRGINGGRSHISFLILNDHQELEIAFEDSSRCRLDAKTGRALK